MKRIYYQIRKVLIEKNRSVIMNDSLGCVLEIDNFDEASSLCKIMNSNTSGEYRYELLVVHNHTSNE
jgi:hypothetical protein